MLNVLKIGSVVIFLLFSQQSMASKYFDGNQVLKMCLAQTQDMSAGCAMFIVGSAETLRMTGYSGEKYCLTEEMSNRQLRKEFTTFLYNHQDSLNYSAASLFLSMLRQNHPCETIEKGK